MKLSWSKRKKGTWSYRNMMKQMLDQKIEPFSIQNKPIPKIHKYIFNIFEFNIHYSYIHTLPAMNHALANNDTNPKKTDEQPEKIDAPISAFSFFLEHKKIKQTKSPRKTTTNDVLPCTINHMGIKR